MSLADRMAASVVAADIAARGCPECRAALDQRGECSRAEWVGAYDYAAVCGKVIVCYWCHAARRGPSYIEGYPRYLPGEHGSRVLDGGGHLVWLCNRCTLDNRAELKYEARAAHSYDGRPWPR